MANQKWNATNRNHLYATLVKAFGPYSAWVKATYPAGKKDEYEEFIADYSRWFQSETKESVTAEAVKQQISWAFTNQELFQDQSHIRNWILNKAAALESGFIGTKDLPNVFRVESQVSNPNAKPTHSELLHKYKNKR